MEIDDYIVASDSSLVELAASGDQQAFEYLFTRYRDALMRLFEQRLGDKDMASDLLQETFIKVYLHIENYSKSFTFGQWIYTIARNTLIDHLRRRSDRALKIGLGYISHGVHLKSVFHNFLLLL
jgi:RNA polymerase sigma-70 factor (ECF subfamily)